MSHAVNSLRVWAYQERYFSYLLAEKIAACTIEGYQCQERKPELSLRIVTSQQRIACRGRGFRLDSRVYSDHGHGGVQVGWTCRKLERMKPSSH